MNIQFYSLIITNMDHWKHFVFKCKNNVQKQNFDSTFLFLQIVGHKKQVMVKLNKLTLITMIQYHKQIKDDKC